ncbi:MAG TPA: hypothetical protein VD968_06120 [Pyrinomonadaceae bacterium]|nr:hypothetical protein [Pyrinomonadaceae bacterium]
MRVLLSLCVACLLLALAPQAARAQKQTASREEAVHAQLQELLAGVGVIVARETLPAAPSRSYREITVAWEADKAAAPAMDDAALEQRRPGRFSRASAPRARVGSLSRQRSLELSPEQLLVVAVDGAGRMKWWSLVPDPRVIRAEAPGPDGVLAGQTLLRESAELLLAFPDDESVTELRLYHPRPEGGRFTLEPVAAIAAR